MSLTEVLSVVIFGVFVLLLVVGAVSTASRSLRYRAAKRPQPRLLGRDRDLLIGLALPFLLIAAVRAFDLREVVNGPEGPEPWWLLITGLPPLYALVRYCWFELFVIERGEQ